MEKILQCPRCQGLLEKKLPHFQCQKCDEKVSTIGNGIPVFLDHINDAAAQTYVSKTPFTKYWFKKEQEELTKLLENMPPGAIIINIGSRSKRLKEMHSGIKNLDICYYPDVDVIADAKALPFTDNSVDMVIFKNVLEHLKDPGNALSEIKRILKPGGKLYVKIPFLQPFHAVPDDFQRYTRSGIKELFKEYHEHEFGVSIGGGSMMAWMVREYLAILTSFGSETLYTLGITFWGWLTFWIKYTDRILKNNKLSDRIASAFYGIYQKPYD